MANLDGVVAMEPYVYDVILQCRSCDRITDQQDSAKYVARFRGRARKHTQMTGHEVEVIIGRVFAYRSEKGG